MICLLQKEYLSEKGYVKRGLNSAIIAISTFYKLLLWVGYVCHGRSSMELGFSGYGLRKTGCCNCYN